MSVRIANQGDIPAIFEVRTSVRENHLDLIILAERGITPESVASMIDGDGLRTWVAEDGDSVAGFVMADANAGCVSALFISPGAEGKGNGRKLLHAAEQWLRAGGWETIWLQTGEDPGNRAHHFYKSAGWTILGPADHGDVRYEKTLSPS